MKKPYETTYDWFISDPESKALLDEEREKLNISEFVLEQMEAQKLSVRKLAEKANVAPNTVLKLRKSEIGTVDHRTLQNVMSALGYAMTITFERQPRTV